ncbi:hypothetical protein [Thermosipho affectus]|uniref:hypothetical protein n=1 Tax=Thermosipho affectus TaxID=660294 RepID=UPI0013017FB0|nr:hypothetical protein [Thermosipho affectus]
MAKKRKIKMHKNVHKWYPSKGRGNTKNGKSQTTFGNVKGMDLRSNFSELARIYRIDRRTVKKY